MVRIYIRHSEKMYNNGENDKYSLDPPLTKEGGELAVIFGTALVKKYGLPTKIFCSPFLRTRETSLLMAQNIKTSMRIRCNLGISEYLGNWDSSPLDVTPETQSYNPPHPETMKQFRSRIQKHFQEYQHLDSDSKVYWFITHGLVIKLITKLIGPPIKHIPILGSIVIDHNSKRLSYSKIFEYSKFSDHSRKENGVSSGSDISFDNQDLPDGNEDLPDGNKDLPDDNSDQNKMNDPIDNREFLITRHTPTDQDHSINDQNILINDQDLSIHNSIMNGNFVKPTLSSSGLLLSVGLISSEAANRSPAYVPHTDRSHKLVYTTKNVQEPVKDGLFSHLYDN